MSVQNPQQPLSLNIDDPRHPASYPSALDLGMLCETGGAFEWLNDEPDLYDDSCGEVV